MEAGSRQRAVCERPKRESEPGAFGGLRVNKRRARGEVAGDRGRAMELRPSPEGTGESQHETHK